MFSALLDFYNGITFACILLNTIDGGSLQSTRVSEVSHSAPRPTDPRAATFLIKKNITPNIVIWVLK